MKIEKISKRQIAAAVSIAIGAGVGASAMAATVVPGGAVYSTEYSTHATANAASQVLAVANAGTAPTFTMGAAYQTGDAVTFTLSNASFSTASAPTVTCATGGSGTVLSPSAASVTTTSSQITFSVANAVSSPVVCTLAGASLTNASLASANTAGIKLGLNVARGGVTVDVGADAILGSAQSTLGIGVASNARFTGQIANFGRSNVSENGRFLTGSTQDATATISATQADSVNPVTLVAASAFTLTLSSSASGGMGWLKNNGTATSCDLDTINAIDSLASSTTLTASNGSCTSVIITRDNDNLTTLGTGGVTLLTMSVGNVSGNYMTAQSFTATGNWNFTAGGVTATKAIALNMGSFTQNGTRVFIPYMPRGTGISQVVTVANTSSIPGTATISGIRSDGATCAASNFGTVALGANRITSLSSAVLTGLTACAGSDPQSFALTVTVNAPADNIEVYSMYNVNGNRVPVINSSNGRQPANAPSGAAGTGNANSDQ